MNRYCTYFDHRYLDRGLAMIRSLRRVDPDCRVSVLCLTPECEHVLARLHEPGVTWSRLADFERENPDLLAIKDGRSLRDYYFTLSGCTVSSALEAAEPGDIVTYLDADLMFYSSPAPIYEAIANASILQPCTRARAPSTASMWSCRAGPARRCASTRSTQGPAPPR